MPALPPDAPGKRRIRLRVAALAPTLTLTEGEHAYVSIVHRATVGLEVEVFDGAGARGRAVVTHIQAEATHLALLAQELEPPPVPEITAYVPWIKGDRMDVCVEKLVEVGVDHIRVFAAHHAVVKLERERLATRLAKLQALALAAARQTQRATVPSVDGVGPLREALAADPGELAGWVLVPNAPRLALPTPVPARVCLVTGPEGGLHPSEIAHALSVGLAEAGLGRTVLRAETAPIVAVALARYAAEGCVAPGAHI